MVDPSIVDRDLVEDLLSDATHPDSGHERVPAEILTALCRAWMAVDGGQVETIRGAIFLDGHRVGKLVVTTDQSMIGQRVRIVKENQRE